MTQPPNEDFAADSEMDDSTQLSSRRPTVPVEEHEDLEDDSTRLSTRVPGVGPDAAEEDDATRLAVRNTGAPTDDSTILSPRNSGASAASGELGATTGATAAATAAQTQQASSLRAARALPDLPPAQDQAAIGNRAREGGFGTRSAAYTPRAVAPAEIRVPSLPPESHSPTHREHVLEPQEAQRKRDAARRASLARAIAIGTAVLVLGSAAVIGILLLVRGLA